MVQPTLITSIFESISILQIEFYTFATTALWVDCIMEFHKDLIVN